MIRKFRRICWRCMTLGVSTVGLVVTLHCIATAADKRVIPSEVGGYLRAYSFREVLDAGKDDKPIEGIITSTDLIRSDLSPSELKLVGSYHNGRVQLNRTVSSVVHYSEQFGKVPRDGVELLTLHDTKHFGSLPQAKALLESVEASLWVGYAVNPAVGKLYDTFSSNGKPLSLRVEPLSGQSKPIPEMSPTGELVLVDYPAWRVVVYGDTSDRVLVDKKFYPKPFQPQG